MAIQQRLSSLLLVALLTRGSARGPPVLDEETMNMAVRGIDYQEIFLDPWGARRYADAGGDRVTYYESANLLDAAIVENVVGDGKCLVAFRGTHDHAGAGERIGDWWQNFDVKGVPVEGFPRCHAADGFDRAYDSDFRAALEERVASCMNACPESATDARRLRRRRRKRKRGKRRPVNDPNDDGQPINEPNGRLPTNNPNDRQPNDGQSVNDPTNDDCSKKQLYIFGMSQGGGIGMVAAVRLSRFKPIVMTYGAPLGLDRSCLPWVEEERWYRFILALPGRVGLKYDPVPYLSEFGELVGGSHEWIGHEILIQASDYTSVKWLGLNAHAGRDMIFHREFEAHDSAIYKLTLERILSRAALPVPTGGFERGAPCSYDDECASGRCTDSGGFFNFQSDCD